VQSNVTLLDSEFAGDCYGAFDGFNTVSGLLTNVNWSGNVHVQNGSGIYSLFRPSDFSTAGPNNQFPNGGGSGLAPVGMFTGYTSCVSVPAGPLTSCGLQASSAYHSASYCDSADCGPNISAIEIAQIRDNDGISSSPAPVSDLTPPI